MLDLNPILVKAYAAVNTKESLEHVIKFLDAQIQKPQPREDVDKLVQIIPRLPWPHADWADMMRYIYGPDRVQHLLNMEKWYGAPTLS